MGDKGKRRGGRMGVEEMRDGMGRRKGNEKRAGRKREYRENRDGDRGKGRTGVIN